MYGPRLCLPVVNVCDVEAPKFARNRRVFLYIMGQRGDEKETTGSIF